MSAIDAQGADGGRRTRRRVARVLFGLVVGLSVLVIGAVALLYAQGKRSPDMAGAYVALGSSYAAGAGLTPRAGGSPIVCFRSAHDYPALLAARLGLALVDRSCSGSTTSHILRGGQMFQRAQVDAVGPAARLVTITSGGNDVGYIGDLTRASGAYGLFGRMLSGPVAPLASRDFGAVTRNLVAIVGEVRRRAPRAQVVIASYLAVVPLAGTCARLGIDAAMASRSREVAARLLAATRAAAVESHALFVDVAAASVGHDACSPVPWTAGKAPAAGAPFHPNAAGARAVADAITAAVTR